jgi:hypothetical protein
MQDENQERKNDMAQTMGSQSALEPIMNECDEECVSLGVCRRDDGSFRGKEGQSEKGATRMSRKQRGKQQARMMRKPERYLKDCILSEQEDELEADDDADDADAAENAAEDLLSRTLSMTCGLQGNLLLVHVDDRTRNGTTRIYSQIRGE